MANLIPPSAKKQVQTEYWIRVASVWLVLLGSAILLIVVFCIPTYILIENQLKAYAVRFDEAMTENEAFTEAEAQVVEANKIANLLVKESESESFVDLLTKLDVMAGGQVDINSFTFIKKKDAIDSISVSGQAETRQSLVSFSDALEADELFESAAIPLSSLAKDRDIPFTISIVPVNQDE